MSQIYPFKRKRAVGKERWYEKIKLSYSGQFQNSLTAKQDVFFQKSLVKDWRNGARHSVPISATFSVFKYLNLTPSLQINDRMYTNKVRRQWDPQCFGRSVRHDLRILQRVGLPGLALSRHKNLRLLPAYEISRRQGEDDTPRTHSHYQFSGNPDFGSPFFGYYGKYHYMNSQGEMVERQYSMFPNAVFGVPGTGRSGSVSLSLANNLEMKVKSDADSTGEKKISLIENFTVSQSYNFAADSMNWSNINTSLMLRLVKNFNLNLNATWDVYTYQLSPTGTPVRVNVPRWKAGKGSDVCRRPAPHFPTHSTTIPSSEEKTKTRIKTKTVGVAARTTMTSMKITTKRATTSPATTTAGVGAEAMTTA